MQTETPAQTVAQTPAPALAHGKPLKIGPQRPSQDAELQATPEPAEVVEASPRALSLELVELELALDPDDLAEHGFRDAVRDAAATAGAEYLFDLPASGLVRDAQRIAVVCLSRNEGGQFGLVLLSPDGDRINAMEPGPETRDLVQFAKAFVGVLEQL
ncbi:hypothetical protein [Hoeflea sp.]|uniref:hypothetical protein n=1 Tax=Hoeflea sp. TaxID=1940281 RepID=UPI003BAFC08B